MVEIPKIGDTNCALIFSIAPTAEWFGAAKLSEVVNHCVGLVVGCYLEAQSSLL